jgi:hypothetical protein
MYHAVPNSRSVFRARQEKWIEFICSFSKNRSTKCHVGWGKHVNRATYLKSEFRWTSIMYVYIKTYIYTNTHTGSKSRWRRTAAARTRTAVIASYTPWALTKSIRFWFTPWVKEGQNSLFYNICTRICFNAIFNSYFIFRLLLHAVDSKYSWNHFISEKYKTLQQFKLHFLQNSPLVQLYTFLSGCKRVGNSSGSHFMQVFSALLLHS